MRNANDAKKTGAIRAGLGEPYGSRLELVEAELTDADSMERAIAGSTYVIHLASPVPFGEPKDEQELIRPAVQGTRAVLEACRRARVRRVAYASSVAVIYNGLVKQPVYTEEHWSDVNAP